MRSAKQRHQFAGLVERTNRKRNHHRKRAALGRKLNMPKDKAGMRKVIQVMCSPTTGHNIMPDASPCDD